MGNDCCWYPVLVQCSHTCLRTSVVYSLSNSESGLRRGARLRWMPLLLLGAVSMISMHFYGGNRWTGTCYLIWISSGLHWQFLDERWNKMFLLSSEALWFLVCGLQRSLLFWFVCGWQAAPTSTAWLIDWCAQDHSQVACGSAPGTNAPVKVGIVFINVSWVANSCWEVRSAIDWSQMIFDLFWLFYCVPRTFMETKKDIV